MNIIFAGTPHFAAQVLEDLYTYHPPIAVYTQIDKRKGRGQKLNPSPVKLIALQHNTPIYQPTSFKEIKTQNTLKVLQPDLIVVVAYGKILPQTALDIPLYGCINIHASLLPRWRGASPIQQAILHGDNKTGISIIKMEASLDTGPILLQQYCHVDPNETTSSLYKKLLNLSKSSLRVAISSIFNHKIQTISQDHNNACYAPKITKTDGLINWQKDTSSIERQIRAYESWPVAYTKYHQQNLRILRAIIIDKKTMPSAPVGSILSINKNGIDIACGQGQLRITKIQWPGKKPVLIKEAYHMLSQTLSTGMIFEF